MELLLWNVTMAGKGCLDLVHCNIDLGFCVCVLDYVIVLD